MTCVARLVAQHLQGNLGQPVVIDNKPGGGTTIGSKAAASAPRRRLHAAVLELGAGDRAGLEQADGIRSAEGFRADRIHRQQLLPADGQRRGAGEFGQGVRRLCQGESRQDESGLRARHGVAARRRVFQAAARRSTSPAFPTGAARWSFPTCSAAASQMYWPTPATVLPLLREGKIKALAISSPERSPDLPRGADR